MNTSQDKATQFKERLVVFALSVINISKTLPKTSENKVITDQLIRSATSIGANYAEANDAISRQDFRSKIFIAKKEAAETRYWLDLLGRANNISLDQQLDEVSQLLRILQKIVSTLKNGK